MSSSSNKIALFIDGANLHATAKTLGFDIDFKRVAERYCAPSTTPLSFKIRSSRRSAR
jgi:hypothetical protein